MADPCAAHHSTTVACGLWQRGPGDAATCETSWRVALCHGNARLHCKDVMGCEGTRCARWQKEGVRDRAAGWLFGVDLIARHYCGILSQHIRAAATAKQTAGPGFPLLPRVPSGWKLSCQLAPWPLTAAAEHPAWQQQQQQQDKHVRGYMYMWCWHQQAVPLCEVASCTHSTLMIQQIRREAKKRQKEISCRGRRPRYVPTCLCLCTYVRTYVPAYLTRRGLLLQQTLLGT